MHDDGDDDYDHDGVLLVEAAASSSLDAYA